MTPDDLNLNVTLKSPKPQRIKWNFTKFLVNKDGEIMYRFSPRVTPEELDPFIASLSVNIDYLVFLKYHIMLYIWRKKVLYGR